MTDLLVEHKWFLVICGEVLFWVLTVVFVILRYWLRLEKVSLVFLVLVVTNELFAAGLAILDYARTGVVGEFQIVMAAFIVYAATVGKQDFKRLDAYLQRTVARWRGERTTPEPASSANTMHKEAGSPDREHARKERRGFYEHLLVFVVGQAILFTIGESWLAAQFGGGATEKPSGLMAAGRIWCVVLLVDGIWSLSYTFFPRQARR